MLPLRHAGLWRFLSVLLLLVVLAATLMPAIWFEDRARVLSWLLHADKWMHGLTFAFLALWFGGLFVRGRYGYIAVGLMAFGLLVEACQLLVSDRTSDWHDVAANAAGITAGLLVAAAGLGGWALWVEQHYSRLTQR